MGGRGALSARLLQSGVERYKALGGCLESGRVARYIPRSRSALPHSPPPVNLMSRLGIRWVVLYFLSILVPAALLAFLSVRSLRDVRDSVHQELRSKAVLAQDAFDRLLNSRAQLLAAYIEEGGMDPRSYAGFSEIAQIFAVDPTGTLRHPAVQPLRLQERRAAFAAQMEQAAEREFGHQDWAGGVQLYHQAWKEAASPAEEAEALNALARCAHKGKDAAMEEKAHRTLVALYGHVFDADGAHPVTLSHLRLGRYAAPVQAQASLTAWTEALLAGPLSPLRGLPAGPARGPHIGPRSAGGHGGPPRSAGEVGPDRESPRFYNALRPRSGGPMGYGPGAGLYIGRVARWDEFPHVPGHG